MAVPGVTKVVQLNSGFGMPALGFGTWKAEPGVVANSLSIAIQQGFRHIDCAPIYQNQEEIGATFEKIFAAKQVTRQDLFITTKLWNTDHHPDQVEAACRRSLEQLKLDYVDLYLIHWPTGWKYTGPDDLFPVNEEGGCHPTTATLAETWAAMEKLVTLGLAKSIGISNFTIKQIVELKKTWKIAPAVNQVEVHPFCPNTELAIKQKELGNIELTAFCPLGVPPMGDDDIANAVFNHAEIVRIAKDAGMTNAALCLQWNLQKGYSVLSKSNTESRIAENAAMLVGGLSAEAMAKVDALFASGNPDFRRRVANPDNFNAKAGPAFIEF